VYHELGHVVHRDHAKSLSMDDDVLAFKDELNRPEFKAALEKIKHYTELGKKAFDNTTNVGSRINKILAKRSTFWIEPEDKAEYTKMLYLRGKEQRADLFAIQRLYKQEKLSAILQAIRDYVIDRNYVVARGSKDVHPSDFERALYMAGFLVDKGMDINKAFKEWELRGKCIRAEEYYSPFKLVKSPAAASSKAVAQRSFLVE
jgi:hypothetical protein